MEGKAIYTETKKAYQTLSLYSNMTTKDEKDFQVVMHTVYHYPITTDHNIDSSIHAAYTAVDRRESNVPSLYSDRIYLHS